MTTTRGERTRRRSLFSFRLERLLALVFALLVSLPSSSSISSSPSSSTTARKHHHHHAREKKSIEISLPTAFQPATSFALETAESVSTCCGDEKFWGFVKLWSNQNGLNGKKCQRFIESAMENAVVGPKKEGAASSSMMMTNALKMSVGLRQFAPRLAMFRALKEEAVEEVERRGEERRGEERVLLRDRRNARTVRDGRGEFTERGERGGKGRERG